MAEEKNLHFLSQSVLPLAFVPSINMPKSDKKGAEGRRKKSKH